MQSNPFILLFCAFSTGVIISDVTSFPQTIILSCVAISLFVLVWQVYRRKPLVEFFVGEYLTTISILFLSLGYTFHSINKIDEQPFHVSTNYLEGDRIVAEIEAIAPLKGKFRKSEVVARQIIRHRDTLEIYGKILCFIEDTKSKLKPRDIIYTNAKLEQIANNNNPGEFDAVSYWKNKGIAQSAFISEGSYHRIGKVEGPWTDVFDQWRTFFGAIIETYVSGKEQGVAKALILGDRSGLDGEITRQFGNTGAMHVLAVSGLHVAILVQILQWILGQFPSLLSKNNALLTGLIIVWIYSFMTGLSASVVRSAWMFTFLSGSTLLQRNYQPFNSLAASALLILIWNPNFLFDIGFQLSYLAMIGIFVFYQPLSKWIYFKNKWIRQAYEGTMVGIAAQIMTVPLTLYYFHQFPNYFILTNLGLMVFSFLVLAVGLALFAFAWWKLAAKYVGLLLTFSFAAMLWIIQTIDAIPGAVSSGFVLSKWMVLLLFGLIFSLYLALKQKKANLLYGVLALGIFATSWIVGGRWQHMETQQVAFLNAKNPCILIQQAGHLTCLYANRDKDVKNIRFNVEAFQKIYPGKLRFIEISQKKTTSARIGRHQWEIVRVKGGYELTSDKKAYFLATSENYQTTIQTVIYSPWLAANNRTHSLAHGAVCFPLPS